MKTNKKTVLLVALCCYSALTLQARTAIEGKAIAIQNINADLQVATEESDINRLITKLTQQRSLLKAQLQRAEEKKLNTRRLNKMFMGLKDLKTTNPVKVNVQIERIQDFLGQDYWWLNNDAEFVLESRKNILEGGLTLERNMRSENTKI